MSRFLLIAVLAVSAAAAKDRLAYIEFFGYQGLDPDAVRAALPFHEGDPLPSAIQPLTRAVVKRITGQDATDVAAICCINDGDSVLFIGLAGKSSRPFSLNPPPNENLRLSADLLKLAREMGDAENAATNMQEVDQPKGYRLMKDPKAQAAELKVREYALTHASELIRVLATAADADQRATAADALGYGDRSPEQIDALVRAARDRDDEVRNNATRALSEILEADPSAAAVIPGAPFVDMLLSGRWTDRNKSSAVLAALTKSRDVGVLGTLKARAWEALLEMARWRTTGWSGFPREILARIAGIPEERVMPLAFGPAAPFMEAIGAR